MFPIFSKSNSYVRIYDAIGSNIFSMFCLQAGQALHVGGLVRLDLSQASVQTIYVTIWASPNVSLHLGKVENAEDIWRNHVGVMLQVNFILCLLI